MAGNSTLTRSSPGLAGVVPAFVYLNTTDSYDTIITPGYLNNVKASGFIVEPTDFVFIVYNSGASQGIFTIIENDGIFTLQLYNPGSGQFQFTQVQFVAKGGSDLNVGNEISFPKLTISAAITALNLSPTQSGLVWVLDNGTYTENIVLPFNVFVNATAATLTCASGDLLTVNDTGMKTISQVRAAGLSSPTGNVVNILGVQSGMSIDATTVSGNINVEGILDLICVNLANSVVTLVDSAFFFPQVQLFTSSSISAAPNATVAGQLQTVMGPLNTSNNFYGPQNVTGKLTYQTSPSVLTVGRELILGDGNTRILYNNVVAGTFTLPSTVTAAIAIGTTVEFTQIGVGAILFAPGVGVTILSNQGATPQTQNSGDTAYAYKYTDTVWIVSGNLIA